MDTVYKTVREAAIAGTLEAIKLSRLDGFEYGGIVVKSGDGFKLCGIVTSRDPHGVQVFQNLGIGSDEGIGPNDVAAIKKLGFAAAFHVHPKTDPSDDPNGWPAKVNPSFFSAADTFVSMKLRGFHYLGSAETGKVYEYDFRSKEKLQHSVTKIRDVRLECPTCLEFSQLLSRKPVLALQGTQVYP